MVSDRLCPSFELVACTLATASARICFELRKFVSDELSDHNNELQTSRESKSRSSATDCDSIIQLTSAGQVYQPATANTDSVLPASVLVAVSLLNLDSLPISSEHVDYLFTVYCNLQHCPANQTYVAEHFHGDLSGRWFSYALYRLLRRYQTFQSPDPYSVEGAGFHGSLPRAIFECLREQMGVTMEVQRLVRIIIFYIQLGSHIIYISFSFNVICCGGSRDIFIQIVHMYICL